MNPNSTPKRLWGVGTARTFRPHWMLSELEIEYETIEVISRTNTMDSVEFSALSNRKKIPLFEDGDLMIGESAAIVLYLVDRYRELGVFAPDPGTNDRARHDELCFFIMSELDAALYIIRRHGGLPEIYGASTTAVESAKGYFLRSCEEIIDRLRDGRAHLLGDSFSVADLLLKTCLDWAGFVAIELPTSLVEYSAALGQRHAYGVAMRKNFTPEALAALTGAGAEWKRTRHSV